ncbi:MAG: dynamin family protein [Prochloraceae cyanobacterium]|nr:dynamin family protein [Prochloraceae cyanobacterium]
MSYTAEKNQLLKELERVNRVRSEFAERLNNIAQTIEEGESEVNLKSGKLGLENDIVDLNLASNNLRQGVFRLMVLGDLKRGKSTLLNALIGEKLLPSDVNPCTALITVLRYGTSKRVTVHFRDGQPPEKLDFESFKEKYTIDSEEAKRLQQNDKLAFPNVEYALVEYPLPILEKGIEIIDSPGLNDTEARNKLALNYLNNCHAILFVFRAIQPCTLEERRYLENYIKDRGLSVFFLVNAWDEIKKELVDPEDEAELARAEAKIRKVFYTNLSEYTKANGVDIYEQRVFEVSSLPALRLRLKDTESDLAGTGFPEFTNALNQFLTQESTLTQMRQAKSLAKVAYKRTHEAIARRKSLIDRNVDELKDNIKSVKPEFEKLKEIRDRFREEIRNTRDRSANKVANSYRNYVLGLGDTFETDFVKYQPNLGYLDFLIAGKREEFNTAFKKGFERYINEKISAWELTAEKEIQAAFQELAKSAAEYGSSYDRIVDEIDEKLIGKKIDFQNYIQDEDNSPGWSKWAMGFFSLATGNVAGVALAASGFDWKDILVNWLAVLGIGSFFTIFAIPIVIFNPIGLALTSLGVGAIQAQEARNKFLKAAKKEFTKALPKIAESQRESIYQTVAECFDRYETEVVDRIDGDIKSRQGELNNLLEQKEATEIDREKELQSLQDLDAKVLAQCNKIESAYEYLIFASV